MHKINIQTDQLQQNLSMEQRSIYQDSLDSNPLKVMIFYNN